MVANLKSLQIILDKNIQKYITIHAIPENTINIEYIQLKSKNKKQYEFINIYDH